MQSDLKIFQIIIISSSPQILVINYQKGGGRGDRVVCVCIITPEPKTICTINVQ